MNQETKQNQLDALNAAIFMDCATGAYKLPVTAPDGKQIFITAHDTEPIASVYRQIVNAGGYVTLFVTNDTGNVRAIEVRPHTGDTATTDNAVPASTAPIGLLLDYVAASGAPVIVPPLNPIVRPASVQRVHTVELEHC